MLPDTHKLPMSAKWDDRFVLEVAMYLEGSGEPLADILKAYNLQPSDLKDFVSQTLFRQKLDAYRHQIRENGLSFRVKARAQAELLLDTSWKVIHDKEVSAAVKADLIKWTAKMAGYEPSEKDGLAQGQQVVVNINLGEHAPPTRIIDG